MPQAKKHRPRNFPIATLNGTGYPGRTNLKEKESDKNGDCITVRVTGGVLPSTIEGHPEKCMAVLRVYHISAEDSPQPGYAANVLLKMAGM